jgi:hypothetical protein
MSKVLLYHDVHHDEHTGFASDPCYHHASLDDDAHRHVRIALWSTVVMMITTIGTVMVVMIAVVMVTTTTTTTTTTMPMMRMMMT